MVVIMAVMAIGLTVAVQSVTFQRQREKEEELIFRGRQAVEAIRLFRARNGRFPLTLMELVEADPRVLRKPWADPITGVADWVPVFLGQEGQVVAGGPADPKEGTPAPDTEARGPIIGVHSRSCQDSIKVYDGRTRYCDWQFVFDPQKQGAGGGGGGGGAPVQPTTPAPRPTRR
jgi:type II secretory pathway pseudopilin PulG